MRQGVGQTARPSAIPRLSSDKEAPRNKSGFGRGTSMSRNLRQAVTRSGSAIFARARAARGIPASLRTQLPGALDFCHFIIAAGQDFKSGSCLWRLGQGRTFSTFGSGVTMALLSCNWVQHRSLKLRAGNRQLSSWRHRAYPLPIISSKAKMSIAAASTIDPITGAPETI